MSIGANVTISRGVEIGDNTKILPNSFKTFVGIFLIAHSGIATANDEQIIIAVFKTNLLHALAVKANKFFLLLLKTCRKIRQIMH